jgi:hypothetical protein
MLYSFGQMNIKLISKKGKKDFYIICFGIYFICEDLII